MPGGSLPAWQRNHWAIITVIFVNFVAFAMTAPFIPLYVQQLGASSPGEAALWTGFIIGISPLMAGLFGPLWGRLADRYGHRIILQRSLIGFAITSAIFAYVTSPLQLLLGKGLEGFCGGFSSVSLAYIASNAPRDRMSEAVGQAQAAQIVSVILGPLLGGFVVQRWGIRVDFLVNVAFYLFSMPVLWLWCEDVVARHAEAAARPAALGFWQALRIPGMLAVVGALFCAQFVDRSFQPVLPLYIASLRPDMPDLPTVVALVTSVGALCSAVSSIAVGRLGNRYSLRQLLLLGSIAGAVLCLPIGLVSSPWQLLVLRAGLGLFSGGMVTVAYSLGGHAAPAGTQGAVFGMLAAGGLMGNASSPFSSGFFASLDLRSIFFVDAALYGLSALLALSMGRGVAAVDRGAQSALVKG